MGQFTLTNIVMSILATGACFAAGYYHRKAEIMDRQRKGYRAMWMNASGLVQMLLERCKGCPYSVVQDITQDVRPENMN